jgi:hypothetical protein
MAGASKSRAGTASVAISSNGTATLVTGVTGKKVKVYSYAVVVDSAGTVKFTGTGDVTGAMSFAANGGISCAPGDDPWFQTASGADLAIVSTAPARGHLSYVIEP